MASGTPSTEKIPSSNNAQEFLLGADNDASFGNRIQCPCENFTALSKIVDVLDFDSSSSSLGDEQSSMRSLLDWLDGCTDAIALKENKLLSCGKRSRCRFRYGTSFAILNAIRDACRPILQNAWTNVDSSSFTTASEHATTVAPLVVPMKYEDAFPPLVSKASTDVVKPHPAASNMLVPPKKQLTSKVAGPEQQSNIMVPMKKKHKRRIRPAQVTESIPSGTPNSVWNATLVAPNRNLEGNITNLPPQDPFPVAVTARASTLVQAVVTPVKQRTSIAIPMVTTIPQNITGDVVATLPFITQGRVDTTTINKGHPHQLENLVRVYTALFRNMLVPSTPLELHLLIRLLVLEADFSDNANAATSSCDGFVAPFFQPMFADYESCQRFAVLALTRLKPVLQNLPIQLLRSLLRCEPFQRQCADVARELNAVLEDYNRQGLLVEYPTESVIGTHAILSLPFDKERDSRHNYKTNAEVAIYKNREESRDAFLGQLRSFMSIKGRILRPKDMEQAQIQVQSQAKRIMNGLLSVNMVWFAQFFCELLLQIGLAPVQETDQELLNIADRDKLQQLHKRFSSRSTQTTKSSKIISMSHQSNRNPTTPMDGARVLFPGYQEFFFLFLHQLPFNFGFHLRGRMAKTILELLSRLSPDGLEVQIVKLQLVARFLGYLIFSPNWHDAGIDPSKIQTIPLADGLQQLQNLGLSLFAQMEQAWGKGQLVATVPWVTELLRMAKWDSLTLTSRQFRQLLAYMRRVQNSIVSLDESGSVGRFGPSMELVSFYLERFFYETIGLPKLTSLPHSNGCPANEDLPDCFDITTSGFSTILMFASSPHMEDLFALVDQICRGLVSKSPSKAKKLRPSVVSLDIGIVPSKLFGEAEETDFLASPVKAGDKNNDDNLDHVQNEQQSIESKLVEAFFHQHRDIKVICDFAVNQVLKRAPSQILVECIEPTFKKLGILNISSEEDLAKAQTLALNNSKSSLEILLEDAIKRGLEVFGPRALHPRVSSIAIKLSVARGVMSGHPVLQTLVSNVSEKVQVELAVLNENSSNDLTNLAVSSIEDIVHAFDGTKCEGSAPRMEDVLVLVRQAVLRVHNMALEGDGSIPAESSVRAFVTSLLLLDRSSTSILSWCKRLPDMDFHLILSSVLNLILSVAAVSSYGLKRLVGLLNREIITRLIETSTDEKERIQVVKLLDDLDHANQIDLDMLAVTMATQTLAT